VAIPEKLFKYCSIDTAQLILSSRTLRWSSPVVYGDPLELQHLTPVNFDRASLLQATIKLAASMIFASSKPQGDTPLINAIRRWREEDRFGNPEEAEGVLGELLAKMVDQRMSTVQNYLKLWEDYNRKVRVCSFSSRPDNTVAWDHFGNNHRGVCFRFDCTDQALARRPQPIQYGNTRPELADLRDQIDAILNNPPVDEKPNFESLFTVKSLSRKLEQEWRCFRLSEKRQINDEPSTWVDDLTFETSELSAVCFGIDTSEADKKMIVSLMKEHIGHTRCYQTNLANGRYDLEIQKA